VPSDRFGPSAGELSPGACREKLESRTIGRLAVNIDALPVVLPVNYVLDGNSIVIRTPVGTKLGAAINETVVAFEVDHFDQEVDRGWSVLVQGRSREITGAERLERAMVLPLRPVTSNGTPDRFVEVEMEIVTGRHIEPLEGPGATARA